MDSSFGTTLLLTFKLAAITTVLLLVIGVPLAYRLSRMKSRLKPWVEAVISMPIVLPPTVLGFYLLLAFSPGSGFGAWLDQTLGLRLVFTFEGLVLGSMIYSLPFMVQPIQAGFEAFPRQLAEASYVLGKSRRETFFRIILPNIKPSLISGTVLAFAHTIGEFGVILMIGGNIPGETRVASIAIYDEVEAMNYGMANKYALVLIGFTFGILLLVYGINRRAAKSVVI
ncbi:molybdate ABC transporter permease subunit [Flavilitoribacter nigricans]|uniref:Molybdenum transport system permease n=1 Tax=Flavilitoribacter nigricans (strain ATCC 23147 / DSM 23189 / NBRC 102662 / NCIMB 1420 / SS-2) TaxID=1122177 RepID=A0A2D0NAZ5_FLAN2|nr:molybdate ABC transporter permease subunit [Flavilitoribacter nigricans]PHN05566.1 molybdate ABC transporter permease subunit [Flavilitoribacter nigricans DSM 23189 = NBRC 102662]